MRRPRQLPLFASEHEGADARVRAARRAPEPVLSERPSQVAGPPLRLAVLGSGSRGNAIVVDGPGGRLLLDGGFSCRELERRLRCLDIEPSTVQAIVITHEHDDHCRGVERFVRRHGSTVWATGGTLSSRRLAKLPSSARRLRAGETARLEPWTLRPFGIAHDAREPIGLVLEDDLGRRIGLASDLGVRSSTVTEALQDLDVLVIESNHDSQMLDSGPYPYHLKRRIRSHWGHLSNAEASEEIEEVHSERLTAVVLYHLSETNNRPSLAAEAASEALRGRGAGTRLVVSRQDLPSDWLSISAPGLLATPEARTSSDHSIDHTSAGVRAGGRREDIG